MFDSFKLAIQKQFTTMKKDQLFRVAIDKDHIWSMYLQSFPEGTNPLFRERTEHDCNTCKRFIRNAGSIVTIKNGKVTSIFDIKIDNFYQVVADALSAYIKSCHIENVFLNDEANIGVEKNFELLPNKETITWNHLSIQLPASYVKQKSAIPSLLGTTKSKCDVFYRALKELTMDSVETVADLIQQNSIYRGDDYKFMVTEFKKYKLKFDKLTSKKELFPWENLSSVHESVAAIRNSAIGSLLVDLSNGVDLEDAVKSFEAKVAPSNYKRPTALVSKAMVENAKNKIIELGYESSMDRRFAVMKDISVNDILYVDRDVRTILTGDVFDEIPTKSTKKKIDKIEEVSIDHFIENILPTASSLEVMLDNSHTNNLVSLIAPCDPTAKTMFKWNNGFSWSYNGEFADSIKERVKKAGGCVDGEVSCRLAWYNSDDLDFHMSEPGYYISYPVKRRKSPNGGMLDVDANGGDGIMENPVENIFYAKKNTMMNGEYTLKVNQFSQREYKNAGFEVEIDIMGTVHHFVYDNPLSTNRTIEVAKLIVKNGEITVKPILNSTTSSKEVWGIKTNEFLPVTMVMNSPNYWDGEGVGNKHFFFMIKGCVNDGSARGFYNEFLKAELEPHRKVMEIVGSKKKVAESNNQLSGVGFSTTQRNTIVCRVTGSFTRTVKVKF